MLWTTFLARPLSGDLEFCDHHGMPRVFSFSFSVFVRKVAFLSCIKRSFFVSSECRRPVVFFFNDANTLQVFAWVFSQELWPVAFLRQSRTKLCFESRLKSEKGDLRQLENDTIRSPFLCL